MESLIIIENENLANYLMFKLDKMNNGFTDDELNKITEMVIDYDLEDDSSFKFLEELRWLKNLRMIVLRNGYIYNDNYNIFLNFNNLEEFVFDNCSFENASLMASLKLKSLSLINCKIEDYTFISVFDLLEELTIINGVVEMERVNKLDNLRYLQLSYSNIIDGDYLQIDRLEELYIDNTNIRDFNFLDGLLNLKELIIDKEQYDSNRELFNKIRERNILVMDNNMVLLGMMVMEYDYKITFKLNTPFSVEYINNKCLEYPGKRILVEVCNTKGIASSMIRELNPSVAIRIAGGFDEDRCRNGHFTGNDYEKAVIYTRNETVKILEEIEKIESGINKNWSDIQKLIYVYDRLKRGIMYEAKYEYKMSSDIRSLRGLITKQTVCAGYALILKEIMDRNDIDCEYVEGYINANKTGGHAWNIVNIDGIKYPIDLTWDNSKFRAGKSNSFDWLGGDISTFCQSHHPMPEERTQDYEHTLHKIDSEVIKRIYSQMGVGRARNYQSTTYYGTRKDGSKYIVAQIGNSRIDNHDYYRYYYVDIADDGTKQEPVILYSDTNIAHLINCKKLGKPIPQNYEETVNNILFSRENIADSINKKTYYIGSVRKSNNSNKLELVSSYQEISKPEDKKNLFVYPTKRFVRSDGSVFIAQQMYKNVHKVSNTDIMRYDILEMVMEDGKYALKGNCVFTERNFFLDNRQEMVDDYLSRERLDRKFNETGGYIGYYDANGFRVYNPDLVKYFETSKRVDIDSLDKNNQQITTTKIPDFNELKKLAKRYEVVIDIDTNDVKVRDIETGEIQVDKSIKDMAMFANIWLTSAGVKYYQDELRAGENYAFNESAEELYNIVCKELENSARGDGVIDTVSLFKNIEKYSSYKYSREIIVNLFRSPYQTEMINRLFLQSLDINYQGQKPETLYSLSYASDLIFDSERSRGR